MAAMNNKKDTISVLHVLHHSVPYFNGGYDIRSHYILKAQNKLGINAYALTRPHRSFKKEKDIIDNIVYYRSPCSKLLTMFMKMADIGLFYKYSLKKRIYELIETMHPEVIHAHTPSSTAIPAMEAAKEKGIRFVYEMRGFWEESRLAEGSRYANISYNSARRGEEYVISHADQIVVISEGLRREIMERGILKKNNIWVVPNGVDLSKFKPRAGNPSLLNTLGLSGKVVIGYISSLRKMEGLSYLIEAMKFVNGKASLMIVGDGTEKERLQAQVLELGLSDKVLFTGKIPHEKILDYYSIIDIFVVPRIDAKVCHIVTPLKPLEAMAMGKCILASRVGGLSEMIEEGKTGLMFEPQNVNDLAEKLNYLINNIQFRHQLGENGLKFVNENRGWDKLCEKYLEVYK